MLATVQELRLMHGGLPEADDNRLQQALEHARSKVRLDGFRESHSEFALLQLYRASAMLETQGMVSGPVAARSVSDVSLSYRQGGSAHTWMDEYREHRLKVQGIQGRFA